DQYGVVLVVADMIVVTRTGAVLISHQTPCGIQSSPHLHQERRTLGIPRRLLVPHPLHTDGASDFARDPGRLTTRIIRRSAAETLRTLHVDNPNSRPWHTEKRSNTGPHAIGLH